ncbi:MAG TPA: energy transducer TonB [Gemmatimonadaceae bacterium]|nr:energy transducer TonB [Gemmatimonadaceae bacterium]
MLVALCVSLVAVPRVSPAQAGAAACPPFDPARTALPCHTDAPPRLVDVGQALRFPSMLEAMGAGGRVALRVLVDTAGHATIDTVLHRDHELLPRAVRQGLARARFEPARRHGARVRAALEIEVRFPASESRVASLLPHQAERPLDASAAVVAQRAVAEHYADKLAPRDSAASTLQLCVSLDGAEPDGALLASLARPRLLALHPRRCPPTFASMVRRTDLPPVPPGADPTHLRIGRAAPLVDGVAVLEVAHDRGTGRHEDRCLARPSGHGWRVACHAVRMVVH